jgi:3-oxoadipate enol-lactonase / 4-carboxymuconolactone decarboxylase
MSAPPVHLTDLGTSGPPDAPLLVLGPSLGTGCVPLWSATLPRLRTRFRVLAWDLPGHGGNREVGEPFTIADLAAAVLAAVDASPNLAAPGERFTYAGVSVGGATGQQLALDVPDRVTALAAVATAPRLGQPAAWAERAALVRAEGTAAVVDGSRERWFAPGFADARPDVAVPLLQSLARLDAEGYAQTCEALGSFDVRDRLGEIGVPTLELLGADDPVCPPDGPAPIAGDGGAVPDGRRVVLDGVAHLPPAEAPDAVVEALLGFLDRDVPAEEGMAVRRAVLGAAHVDRAAAAAAEAGGMSEEFQRFITAYAWGGIWTRPGLDRRTRSFITLTALMARGHDEEFAMHVRAARRNGLSEAEIGELVLQCAIYLGVPDANHALKLVRTALAEHEKGED